MPPPQVLPVVVAMLPQLVWSPVGLVSWQSWLLSLVIAPPHPHLCSQCSKVFPVLMFWCLALCVKIKYQPSLTSVVILLTQGLLSIN